MALIKIALIMLVQNTVVFAQDITLETAKGTIVGTTSQTVGLNKTYYAFKGIPYAEPPKRFQEAVPKAPWTGTLNCTYDKDVCVQGKNPIIGSEDCLFLSVYTTSLTGATPVIVFIHGGYFTLGNSSYEGKGPDFFLDEGVVFVMLQYRLGLFGFITTEDSANPGNWGLKDQVLALQWVRDNIQYFGGDPTKVTLWGQSVGGASVGYHLVSNRSQGLFHGAIMESGTSLSSFGFNRRISQTILLTATQLGKLSLSIDGLVQQLKTVPYKDLQSAAYTASFAVALRNPLAGLFYGVVSEEYHNKTFFTGRCDTLLREGKFAKVPILLGTTSQEGRFVGSTSPSDVLSGLVRSYFLTFDILPNRLPPPDLATSLLTRSIVGTKIKYHFAGLSPIGLTNDELVRLLSVDQWVRPAVEFARQVIQHGVDVYMYSFSYKGVLGRNTNATGVAHSEDLAYLFNTANGIGSGDDYLTRLRYVRFLCNFAKTKNPTPITDQLFNNTIWTPVKNGTRREINYLDIDRIIQMKINMFDKDIHEYDKLYNDYGIGDYQTY
uniref:CarE n=1 Tax=Agasicles hygrophila TaxID=715812 RepID=A0A3Q8AD62_9CUCU|nr:CarE [Agasicles hygrophila]